MLREYTAYFVVETYVNNEIRKEAGFYPATTFAEAMDYIEEYYAEDLCAVKHLELLDISLVSMRPEVAKEILTYNYG
jgi:hypothetical protein